MIQEVKSQAVRGQVMSSQMVKSGGEGSGSEEYTAGSEGSGINDAADGKDSGRDESSSKKEGMIESQ